jgi:hypothetical protein
MKKGSILLLLCFVSLFACAQSGFSDGYLVKMPGDTLKGKVLIARNMKQATIKVHGKPTETIEVSKIKSVGLEFDRLFLPKKVDLDIKLVEVLMDGGVELSRVGNIFYLDGNQGFTLLDAQMTTLYRDGKTYRTRSNDYQATLAKSLADCPAVANKTGQVPYDRQALVELVSSYNECKQLSYHLYDSRSSRSYNFYVGLGYSTTSLSLLSWTDNDILSASQAKDLGNGNFGASPAPLINIGLLISRPKMNQNLAWFAETSFISNTFEGGATKAYSTNTYNYKLNVTASTIRLAAGPRFALGAAYVKVGPQFGKTLSPKFTIDQMVTSSAAGSETNKLESKKFRSLMSGLCLSVGAERPLVAGGSLFAEARAELGNGYMGSGVTLSTSILNVGALVGMRF